MKIQSFTRFASLLLAVGFFVSCAGSKGPTIDELTQQGQYDLAVQKLDEQISEASDEEKAPLYLRKTRILGQWAEAIPAASERDSVYRVMRSTVTEGRSFTTDRDLNAQFLNEVDQNWNREYEAGIDSYEDESAGTRFSSAIAHFDNAILLDQGRLSAYRSKSVAQLEAGETSDALTTLESGVAAASDVPQDVYKDLAFLYLKNNDTEAAFENYDRAGVDIVNDRSVAYTFVNALIREQKHEDAVTLLESLVDLNPSDAQLRGVYGTELFILTSEIANDLKAAYQQNDNSLSAQLRFELEGNGELAENNLVAAYQLDKENPDNVESLAVFYNNLSAEYLELAEVAFDEDKSGMRTKAMALGSFALNYYEELLDMKPDDAEIQQKVETLKKLFQK